MELDGTLLADCFENFRTQCLCEYGLNPAHFLTSPSLSREACLKKSGVKLDVITDPDINLFMDSALIGGVSLARNPYLKAKNEMSPEVLGTFPRATSQAATSQGYFPKWQLPHEGKTAFSP